jgi:hypothetical protein
MEPPKLTSVGDTYLLRWEKEAINIRINRIVEKSEGVSGELLVTKGDGHLYQTRINLLSQVSKTALAKELSGRLNSLDWRVILEQAFTMTLASYRTGEPVIKVGDLLPRTAPRYRLKPIILENELTALYALGGSGKSATTDLFAVLVQTGWSACGFAPIKGDVLILDWETSKETVDERVKAVKKGMGITSPELVHYRRCYRYLADEIGYIQEQVAIRNIKLVIVDSANMASGIGLDYHGPALAMIGGLRSLGISVLIVDHKPKMGDQMFGSVTKYNACRATWELQGQQEDGSPLLNLGLFHTKHNDTPKNKPIGLQVNFGMVGDVTDTMSFTRQDIENMPLINETLPVKMLILNLLKGGPLRPEDIASELGKKDEYIRKELTLLKQRNMVVNLGDGTWGLASRNEE